VQRTLTARNIKEGRRGTIWGAFLKLLPVLIFLVPGIIALALKNQGVLDWDSPDQAFPSLLGYLLPSGLRGLVAAGLLAALMSSLASVFNSCATLFTVDIYEKLRPGTPEKKLVNIGRLATGVVVVLGVLWIPIMQNISGVLYEYLQSVQAYIAPPITAVFLLGIFFKRINGKGALATLFIGIFVAAIRLILELSKDSLDPSGILFFLGDLNFLEFSSWFFVFSVLLAIVISFLSEVPDEDHLSGLTYGTLSEEQKVHNRTSYNMWDILATVGVLAIVIAVMLIFSGN
jgi:SSS family solute:Na+ symporter